MGVSRTRFIRQIMHFSPHEDALLQFAMRCTGLDKTATMRLMMRRGIIDEIIKYRETGVPKISGELLKIIDDF